MLATLVMTIIGADRPGLVELVSARVADHGGNWLESRLSHLGGQFAGLVRVAVPEERAAALTRTLTELEKQGLRVVIQSAGDGQPAPGLVVVLSLVGHDRPGIVRQITGVLAEHQVNVEEFSSECVSAPMDGSTLFQAQATVSVPPTSSLAAVRRDLEKIAADLMVDVQLNPPER